MKPIDLVAFAAILLFGLLFAQLGVRALETEQKGQDQVITSHIDYRQNGKEYKYFIAAKNAEVAEQILMQDAQDETQPQVQQIVTYGEV